MRGGLTRLILAGAMALAATAPGAAHKWNSGDTAAAIVGGALLGAAAVAASSSAYRHQNQYVPPRPPYRPSAAPFSPARGVTCYPREWACYNNDGDFLPTWTNRVF